VDPLGEMEEWEGVPRALPEAVEGALAASQPLRAMHQSSDASNGALAARRAAEGECLKKELAEASEAYVEEVVLHRAPWLPVVSRSRDGVARTGRGTARRAAAEGSAAGCSPPRARDFSLDMLHDVH